MSRESKILIGILVAVVGSMITLFIIANKNAAGPTAVGDKTKIVRDNSHKTGTGAIQIVEFGDYQCPSCGSAHPSLKQLAKDYESKITFYFRNFPLSDLHKNARLSAQAAEAAGDQNKFWEMHDKLYESQKEWSEMASNDATVKFESYAKDLGLDVEKFKKALADKQFDSIIDQDLADGNAIGITGTPTFFIDGELYKGKWDYATLRDVVEAKLKK